jgi:hypothetical protein
MGARYYTSLAGRFISPDLPGIDQHIANPQSWNLYHYARNNPLHYTDPTGHAAEAQYCSIATCAPMESSGDLSSGPSPTNYVEVDDDEQQSGGAAAAQGAQAQQNPQSSFFQTPLGKLLYNFVDGDNVAQAVTNMVASEKPTGKVGGATALVLTVAVAIVPAGKVAKGIVRFARGAKAGVQVYRSMSALRRALGPAGKGLEWHHIVEQCKACQFGPEAIHNTDNVIGLIKSVHEKISRFYSTKQDFAGSKVVREWLKGQSFEQQRAFGLKVLRDALEGKLP